MERHWPVLRGHEQRVRGTLPTGLLAEGQGDCVDGPAGQFLAQDGLDGTDELIAGTEGHQQAEPHWHLAYQVKEGREDGRPRGRALHDDEGLGALVDGSLQLLDERPLFRMNADVRHLCYC